MSINLPGYGTAGWGATLNNYLRSLEKRLNVIEGKVNSNSTVEEQILAVSRYAGSGLTSTSTTIKQKNKNDGVVIETVEGTISLTDGDKLTFENLSYYIAASLTNSGGSHITFDTAKTWTFNKEDLTINQSTLLVIDQNGVISLLPKIVNGSATGTTPTNLNFCRLGYVTKLDEDYLFTPAPEIASLNTSSKFEFWSSPKIRTQRQNSNSEAIGDFTFSAEGLGYCQNASSVNNILINDFDILNTLTYKGVGKYYTITGTNLSGESDFDTTPVDGLNFNDSSNKNNGLIRVYYVTLIGKVFCCTYSVKKDEMPITSQELGSYQLNRQDDGAKLLFENYRYICPVEVFRLAKNKYGTIISYSNTYNGFSPQLHNTPIFGSNNAVNWNQFHFMQNSEATGSNSSQYDTLSIRPIVNTDSTKKVNSFVTIDTTTSTTVENDEILLMKHDYKKALNIKSDSNISLTSSQFSIKAPIIQFSNNSNIVGYEYNDETLTKTVEVQGTANVEDKKLITIAHLTTELIGTGTYAATGSYDTGFTNSSLTKNNFSITYPEGQNYSFSIVSFDATSGTLTYKMNSILQSATASAMIYLTTYCYESSVACDSTVLDSEISGKNNTIRHTDKTVFYTLRGAAASGQILKATITYSTKDNAYHDFKGKRIYLNKESSTYVEADSESTVFNSKNLEIACPSILMDSEVTINGAATLWDNLTVYGTTSLQDNLDVKGTVTWTSDRNLKTNITPMIFNSTEFINSIPLYNYALKSTPSNQTIGLMAQDLQQYLPQLVHEAQDGHLTIEETKLVYICIDALKQANQRIELLEGKVNDLCNKISQYHL